MKSLEVRQSHSVSKYCLFLPLCSWLEIIHLWMGDCKNLPHAYENWSWKFLIASKFAFTERVWQHALESTVEEHFFSFPKLTPWSVLSHNICPKALSEWAVWFPCRSWFWKEVVEWISTPATISFTSSQTGQTATPHAMVRAQMGIKVLPYGNPFFAVIGLHLPIE